MITTKMSNIYLNNWIANYIHPKTITVINSYLFLQFLWGEPSMILKFPDFWRFSNFPDHFTEFPDFSLTLKKNPDFNDVSLTSGHLVIM